ncbi:MAG TPA: hypothetical protein VHL34_08025 [Rhizomicrobium sp.]|jgi:hypothetical protein|nr:hypothetical protein [Rhizomicrobium sp.]
MPAAIYETLPAIAAVCFLAGTVLTGARADRPPLRNGWMISAALSALFLAFSIYTVAMEGPVGFWANHTVNAWGNQVWIDLLIAVGTAYALVARDAARLGMRPLLWLIPIVCTGSIGLLAMVSRYQFLKAKENEQ